MLSLSTNLNHDMALWITDQIIVASHLIPFWRARAFSRWTGLGFVGTDHQKTSFFWPRKIYLSFWMRHWVLTLVLLDLNKTFDVVFHSLLLQKLLCLGCSARLIEWITNFLLVERWGFPVEKPWVALMQLPVVSHRVRGFGPLLFLLYMNHISSTVTCKFKAFADDCGWARFGSESEQQMNRLLRVNIESQASSRQ